MVSVTVIMPVYNSENYVKQAVNSILKQTMSDFELILVDDGSSDASGRICDELSEKDKRIHVIHQRNGGICSARNAGLTNAKGKYVAFCDNDDLYEPDLLEANLLIALSEDADMVRFRRRQRTISADHRYKDHISPEFPKMIIKNNIGKYYKDIRTSGNGVWSAIYKKEFLEAHHIRFDETMKYGAEDIYFNLTVLSKEPVIALNPGVYYNWIKRELHSTSAKFNENWLVSIKKCLQLEVEVMEQYKVGDYCPGFCESWVSASYIYEYIQYLNMKQCPFSLSQRISKIKELRDMAMFRHRTKTKTYRALKRLSQKDFIIYKLFDLKLYYLLYYLIGRKK